MTARRVGFRGRPDIPSLLLLLTTMCLAAFVVHGAGRDARETPRRRVATEGAITADVCELLETKIADSSSI
jgi:hypothetical protein